MNLFVVREYEEFAGGRVLLPLRKLIERISFAEVAFWSLRRITLTCNSEFFGIAVIDLEKLSRRLSGGVILTNQDFQSFLRTDFQIIDGYIDGYGSGCQSPLFQIECVDTGQWEISTDSHDLALQLEKRWFFRQDF